MVIKAIHEKKTNIKKILSDKQNKQTKNERARRKMEMKTEEDEE